MVHAGQCHASPSENQPVSAFLHVASSYSHGRGAGSRRLAGARAAGPSLRDDMLAPSAQTVSPALLQVRPSATHCSCLSTVARVLLVALGRALAAGGSSASSRCPNQAGLPFGREENGGIQGSEFRSLNDLTVQFNSSTNISIKTLNKNLRI